MDPLTDIDLVQRYHQGDERALIVLIERYFASIYRFLAHMLNDRIVAEDLTQETFVKAWKHLKQFDLNKAFKPWLFSIARHTAIDYLRKKQPILFSTLQEEDDRPFADTIADVRALPSDIIEQRNIGEQLTKALSQLPPNARAVILMHETEELTFQEISDALKEPLNTVKSRYRRALLTLQTLLTPQGDLIPPPPSAPKPPKKT